MINQCAFLPPIVSGSSRITGPSERTVHAGGASFTLLEERREIVNAIVEQSFLQDISNLVWPGAIIQGKPLNVGDIAEIKLPHGPGTLQIVTDLVTNTPHDQSHELDKPDSASVGNGRRELLRKINPQASPGMLKTDYQKAYSLRELGVKVGLDIKGSGYGVQVDASYDSSYTSNTVVATIRQTYYVTVFDPDAIGAYAFDASVKSSDLEPFLGPDNPPLMIDSVHYGRVLVVTATGKASTEKLKASLAAQVEGMGSGILSAEYTEIIQSSQVRVYSVGAVAGTLPTTLTNPVAELDRIYKEGLNFTLEQPGAPIAFTAKYLRNWALAHIGLKAQYIHPVKAIPQGDVNTSCEVWDGAGGGPRDTGIDVVPGDQVLLSAYGSVFSGVWAAGTHP